MQYALEHRSPTMHEHNWLVYLHNDPLVLNNVTDPTPITLHSHLMWWNRSIEGSKTQQRLLFMINGKLAGFTKYYSIDRVNGNCVLGADLHADYRGQGHAHGMWTCMLQHCFETLGLHRVSLTTAAYNEIGQKVYRRLGFVEEGRLVQSLCREGVYHDQVCMYLLKEMWKR